MEKVWLKSYHKKVPEHIDTNSLKSLNRVIEDSYEKYPDKPAFTCMGKTLTFSEMKSYSDAFGCFLLDHLKLSKGDRVALMMPNVLQYPIALHGALRSSLTVVNVNPLYTATELKHQLNDSGAKTILILENFAHVLQEVIHETQVENVITTSLGELLGFPKKNIVNFVVKYVKKMVPSYNLPKAYSFSEAITLGQNGTFQNKEIDIQDIAFLQYTGGTTGVSKGAVLTHYNISANISQAGHWLRHSLDENSEVVITPLPLYHIFSLTANCLTLGSIGAHNILITNPRDIPNFIKTLKKTPFTVITGVNTLFNALLNHPEFKDIDFSTLKIALGGGMAVQSATAQKWKDQTGKPIVEAYGLTETSPAACINPLDIPEYNGSIGLPISSTEVSIHDDDGKELPMGEEGELWIKGPQVMEGYWNRPEETAKSMEDGWFKTGDIATMDSQGYFKIVDRKKDMILVSGFNVYPNEIEQVAALHPGIVEVAAVAVPDSKSGEVPKLFVVKKDEELSEAAIIEYCRKKLTGYKVPKFVEFRDELPKTNVGKILRRALRES